MYINVHKYIYKRIYMQPTRNNVHANFEIPLISEILE